MTSLQPVPVPKPDRQKVSEREYLKSISEAAIRANGGGELENPYGTGRVGELNSGNRFIEVDTSDSYQFWVLEPVNSVNATHIVNGYSSGNRLGDCEIWVYEDVPVMWEALENIEASRGEQIPQTQCTPSSNT